MEVGVRPAHSRFGGNWPDLLQLGERRDLLRFGETRIYDITGFSLPMLFDVDAYTPEGHVPAGAP